MNQYDPDDAFNPEPVDFEYEYEYESTTGSILLGGTGEVVYPPKDPAPDQDQLPDLEF